jgi:hypothetical protein
MFASGETVLSQFSPWLTGMGPPISEEVLSERNHTRHEVGKAGQNCTFAELISTWGAIEKRTRYRNPGSLPCRLHAADSSYNLVLCPSCPTLIAEVCGIEQIQLGIQNTVDPVLTEIPNDHAVSRQGLDFDCRTGQRRKGFGEARHFDRAALLRVGWSEEGRFALD